MFTAYTFNQCRNLKTNIQLHCRSSTSRQQRFLVKHLVTTVRPLGIVTQLSSTHDCITLPRLNDKSLSNTKIIRISTPLTKLFKDVSLIGTLYKWKLSLWIALSTVPGYIMMTSAIPVSSVILALTVGSFLCSGGANAFNQIIECDRDAVMIRTRTRPLPSNRITYKTAFHIATLTSVAGIAVLLHGTNPMTAFLGAVNIGLYTLLYTPLKIITPYNTHIGSVVGSIPTIMGCTAAGASLLTPDPWMLFAIQTLWQFPHFYGLAWRYRQDYLKGGFVLFPLKDSTGHETAKMMKPYVIATILFPFATATLSITNLMFIIDGAVVNYFLWNSFTKFQKDPSVKTSRRFFGVSLWHLLVLLALSVFHSRSMHNRKIKPASTTATHSTVNGLWSTIHSKDHDLQYKIESLRELVQEFCIHKQFYDPNGDLCIFERIARLASGSRLKE